MMWSNHGAWGASEWLSMSLMMLLFWGLVVALVVWLVRSARASTTGTAADRPEDVLADRFARGEIDDEEFRRRRELLHSVSGGPSSTGGESR